MAADTSPPEELQVRTCVDGIKTAKEGSLEFTSIWASWLHPRLRVTESTLGGVGPEFDIIVVDGGLRLSRWVGVCVCCHCVED